MTFGTIETKKNTIFLNSSASYENDIINKIKEFIAYNQRDSKTKASKTFSLITVQCGQK